MTRAELFAYLRKLLPQKSVQEINALRDALCNADPKHLEQLTEALKTNPNAQLHVDVRKKNRGQQKPIDFVNFYLNPEEKEPGFADPGLKTMGNRKERRKAAALARRKI